MSHPLLLMESEANATLHDALAFIDAFEGQSTSSNSSGGVWSEESTKSKAPAKKKKRSHTERVKNELERLRTDAKALEATLERLKRSSSEMKQLVAGARPQVDSHSSSSLVVGRKDPRMVQWMAIVVDECRRRRESEALNRRLRAMLAKQVNMVQVSESALSLKISDAVRNNTRSVLAWSLVLTDRSPRSGL